MIKLSNGHAFDFVAAAGALNFDGRGYWWEAPFRWMGLLDPTAFTIITKTLTLEPKQGNYRWYCPWRSFRLLKNGGALNSLGLPNQGMIAWSYNSLPVIDENGYKIIVSVMPYSVREATKMGIWLEGCRHNRSSLVAVELNASCPNIDHEASVEHICKLVETLKQTTDLPLIVKLGYQQPSTILKSLDGKVAAFDLINTVPWSYIYNDRPSPLAKYKLEGGVSGKPITWYGRTALQQARDILGIRTPIISGGGVYDLTETLIRFNGGAGAVSFGTLFTTKPWAPNQIVKQYRSLNNNETKTGNSGSVGHARPFTSGTAFA